MKNIRNKALALGILGILFFSGLSTTTVYIGEAEQIRDDVDWWPTFGHDIARTSASPSAAPETNTVLFSTQLWSGANAVILQGPTVVDGMLFLSWTIGVVAAKQLVCADALTGALIWNVTTRGEIYYSPTVVDGKIYYFDWSPDYSASCIYCRYANNGTLYWVHQDANEIFVGMSSPLVTDEYIFFGESWWNSLRCLYTSNGSAAWTYYGDMMFDAAAESSPAYADGKVYICGDDGTSSRMYCFDAVSGADIWTYDIIGQSGAKTPTVVDGRLYIGVGRKVYCLDAVGNGDGTTDLYWTYQTPTTGSHVTSTAVAYGNVYVGADMNNYDTTNYMYALNAETGALVWSYNTIGVTSTPSIADNKVYCSITRNLFAPDTDVICLDAMGNGDQTTDLIWSYTLPDHDAYAHSQPSIGFGTVWVATDKCWLYAFSSNHVPTRPERPTGPAEGFTGVNYTYSSSSTDPDGDTIQYMWDWGDGTYSDWSEFIPSGEPIVASHTWDSPDTYLVKVQAKDSTGFVTAWSIGLLVSIEDYENMTVDAHGPYTGVSGQPIPFTGSVSGGAPEYSWFWDFGNGETATVQNPTYLYPLTGEYTIALTVTDSFNNSASDSTTATITSPAAPELVIDTIIGGFGLNAVIRNNGSVDATNVTWSIRLEGGLILLGAETTGAIDNLAAGEEEILSSRLIIGFGQSTINVSATCKEGASVEKTADGFVLLFFVLGL